MSKKSELSIEELKNKLSELEFNFCEEYLVNGRNGTAAYSKVADCSYNSAKSNSWRMLNKEHVKKYINAVRAEMAKSYEIDREYIIEEYMEIINTCKSMEKYKDLSNWNKALQNLTDLMGLKENEQLDVNHKIDSIKININRKKKDDQ